MTFIYIVFCIIETEIPAILKINTCRFSYPNWMASCLVSYSTIYHTRCLRKFPISFLCLFREIGTLQLPLRFSLLRPPFHSRANEEANSNWTKIDIAASKHKITKTNAALPLLDCFPVYYVDKNNWMFTKTDNTKTKARVKGFYVFKHQVTLVFIKSRKKLWKQSLIALAALFSQERRRQEGGNQDEGARRVEKETKGETVRYQCHRVDMRREGVVISSCCDFKRSLPSIYWVF